MADQKMSSEDVKKLRTPMRNIFTRTYHALKDGLEKKTMTPEDIDVNYRKLQGHQEKLLRLNEQFMDALLQEDATDKVIQDEFESVEEYQDKFLLIQSKIDRQDKEESFSTATSRVDPNKTAAYRLPKLEFKKYGGEPRDWITFWSQFKVIHEDQTIPEDTKFNYLIMATAEKSEARDVVESFPASPDNYKKVIDYLKSRFGDEEVLVEIYVRDLLENVLHNVKAEGKVSVVKLYDKLETQLRALETLGVTRQKNAAILYPLVESALPEDTLRVWERQLSSVIKSKDDKLTQLMNFLETEVKGENRVKMAKAAFKTDKEESSDKTKKKHHQKKGSDTPTATDLSNTTQRKRDCIFCGKGHQSQECFSAQKMTLSEREGKVSEKNACFACLIPGHRKKHCKSRIRCVLCGGKHYPIMCPEVENPKPSTSSKESGKWRESSAKENATSKSEATQDLCNANIGGVYLQTLIAKASGEEGACTLRVGFDSGSMKSYITKKAVNVTGAKECCEVTLTHQLFGGGELQKVKHKEYKVQLSNIINGFSDSYDLLDQEKICGHINQITDMELVQELKEQGITLTDIYKGQERDIHILIGADLYGKLVTGRTKKLKNGLLATETLLGWTIMGPSSKLSDSRDNNLFVSSLLSGCDIQDMWRLDVLGIQDEAETKSKEDLVQASKEHFMNTVKQNEDGRYVVSLPWIENHPQVPVNRRLAEGRLQKELTGRLKSEDMFQKYDQIFKEWEEAGIIEEVQEKQEKCSHLPHRPVVKDSKSTPVRPVFDASARPKGRPSVNQCLGKGANLIELIPDLILRSRIGRFAVSADIRKAFLQILVRMEDRDFLRFLWVLGDKKTLKFYRHCRVVFGLTCSPFLLAMTIIFHLSQPKFQNNWCAQLLIKSFYVDNCILSLSSEEEVQKFIKEATDIMMQAKFELRDWTWNDPQGLETAPVPLLGMTWYPHTDTIAIDVKSLASMDEKKPITKRNVLSACHRIFDPIGFTCPATIGIKKMVQDAWKKKKSWDEPLELEMQVQFAKWKKKVLELEQIRIPRWILPIEGRKTLHVFCDASAIAYATVIFMRVENASMITLRFVDARNRLATIKKTTIPRLELLSCLIGARLAANARENLGDNIDDIVYWTDSSTALYWIQGQETWATFVDNRVKDIKAVSKSDEWRHVAGVENPADLPSRGCSPSKFVKSGWWEGPQWLQDPEEDWPKSRVQYDLEAINEEMKKSVVSAFDARKPEEDPWYFNLYQKKRQVTLPQMLRVFAWMLRMKNRKYGGDSITQDELDDAEKALIRVVQNEMISEDDPKVQALHAFKDKEGLWRVKTKIFNRKDKEYFRLPFLLPTDHPITKLIIETMHKSLFHCGVQALQSALREKYWIPKARMLIRHVVHVCPRCRRWEAKRVEVPEAPLPPERVQDAVAFEVTGIDLGGPLYLKNGEKAWFVLFTCAVYRAAHIELVTSLSTKALMGALERFVARRGCPAVIFSNNGTNLVGVRNELIRVNSGIKWKLNPPAAPWWGGWFERVIGMTKRLIRRILGRGVADYEEMMTILANCERVINARPLTYLAEDNEDLVPLTPEMFLREPRTEGEIDLNDLDCNFGDKYKERKRLFKEFRKRFRTEYLGLLVHRDNRKKQRKLKVGDIVLVEVDNQKQIHWPMGRIVRVYEGFEDGRRVVDVQTNSGVIKRAVQRLFPLEVPSDDIQQVEAEVEQETAENESIAGKAEEKEKATTEKAGKVFTRSGREVRLPLKLK